MPVLPLGHDLGAGPLRHAAQPHEECVWRIVPVAMTPSASTPKFMTLPEIRRAARERLPRDHWNFGDGAA